MNLSLDLFILLVCWMLFFAVWGLGWFYNLFKSPKSQRKGAKDYLSVIGVVLVFLVSHFVSISSAVFAPPPPLWLDVLGVVFLVAGTGLALWSRLVLGVMWSNRPQVKEGHELRTDGPYHISRHPIYTGMLGMLFGSVLVSGINLLFLLVAVLFAIRLVFKIPEEERLMIETFGEQYWAYQRQVPLLIPEMQWLRR